MQLVTQDSNSIYYIYNGRTYMLKKATGRWFEFDKHSKRYIIIPNIITKL